MTGKILIVGNKDKDSNQLKAAIKKNADLMSRSIDLADLNIQ